MKNKAVCVHGHFYQPPRENPWTGLVEPEESAFPYRDWNSRITAECYGPLASTYQDISFNFGPTLLRWLEVEQPALYRRITAAKANALAQPYVHAILPLCSDRDKRTLIRWGLDDFRRRYGRAAESIWLPETAVDDATLEAVAAAGLKYVILGADQARWQGEIDPTRPYSWRGKLAIFFYHSILSRGVETGESLVSAEALARRVMARFLPDDSHQLVSVCSDGEFYGHHHKHGARVLEGALRILREQGVEVTTYGRYLQRFPPPQEVEVVQESSWSCAHGIARWTRDCGCKSKSHPSWTQEWRAPLRGALDRLAADIDAEFEKELSPLLQDPWAVRDGLMGADLDFLIAEQQRRELDPEERRTVERWMAAQRQRLEMLTSCGWFFDDISGLETAQLLKHAARAIELAGVPAEPFVERLSRAPSNVKAFGDGAGVWRKLVLPCRMDDARATARRAILQEVGLYDSVEVLPGFNDRLPHSVRRGDRLDVTADVEGKTYGIDALLPEERKHAMRLLLPDPAGSETTRRWLLRWAAQIAEVRRGGDGEELLKMLEESQDPSGSLGKRLPVSQLPWLDVPRRHLESLLEDLLEDDAPPKLARAMRWVEAFQRSGAPVELWKLRQFARQWQDVLKTRGCPSPAWETAAALSEAVQ